MSIDSSGILWEYHVEKPVSIISTVSSTNLLITAITPMFFVDRSLASSSSIPQREVYLDTLEA